ncbi:MAG: hypothetical protein OQL06_00710 [Gammaproteobacteria bacterium]|nr:hypothetical protein [Gammaproteobacteria bacterium]
MQLDQINLNLRDRYPWEAMDLGIKLMRTMWPSLLVPWLLIMLPVLACILFLQLNGYILTGLLLLWLCKPIYDSLVLHILSRGIFSDYPGPVRIIKGWRQWLPTGIYSTIFIWRLSLARSFNMPVHQLEGLKGNARKQRLRILHKKYASHANGLTIICLHFEFLINLTLYGLLFILIPKEYAASFMDIFTPADSDISGIILNTVFYWLAIFILEPFYVASGFTLYLNRRTQLEAWDIELAFRKMAQRLEHSKQHDINYPDAENIA